MARLCSVRTSKKAVKINHHTKYSNTYAANTIVVYTSTIIYPEENVNFENINEKC
jgi:hypothetical protein